MENLETQPPNPPTQPPTQNQGPAELQARFESLQSLVTSMLIVLFVLTGTLIYYFAFGHLRFTNAELRQVRPRIAQAVADYNKNWVPGMNDFIQKLQEYGRTHPDFVPILAKYNLKPPQPVVSPTAVPPASTPAKK